MKLLTAILFLLPITSVAATDLTVPKTVHQETFRVWVDASGGAFRCLNKIESAFGDLPASISIDNRGGPFGLDRVRDDNGAGRTSRIEFFGMKLPDGVECKDIEAQLPKSAKAFSADRELQMSLLVGSTESRMVVKEIVKLNISKDLVLTGSSDWNDFQVPNNEIIPDRDPVLQMIDRSSFTESIALRIYPSTDGLECVPAKLINDQFQLALNIRGGGRLNTQVVSRAFPSRDECVDQLTEMMAEISMNQVGGQGLEVQVDRELSLIRRDAPGGNNNNLDKVMARGELVNLTLLGLKFSGSSVLPLWPTQ